MSEETTIRLLSRDDLPEIVRVHLAAFPDAAITRLGREAARRFYESLMSNVHDAFGLGAWRDKILLGFCFGGVWRQAKLVYVRQNMLFLASLLLVRPWLLRESFFRKRIRFALGLLFRRKARSARVHHARADEAEHFGIQSTAVDPRFQGTGIGGMLLDTCEEYARQRGFDEIILSVHRTNHRAIEFYECMGWEKVIKDGAWTQVMVKRLA